jgi:hypothetical protein
MHIRVKQMDWAKVREHASIHIVGARGTGKTLMRNHILQQLKSRFHFGIANSGMDCESLKDAFGEWNIANDDHDDALEHKVQLAFQASHAHNLSYACCISDTPLPNVVATRAKCLINGRCLKMTLLSETQCIDSLKPQSRNNVDYIVVTKLRNAIHVEKLFTSYAGQSVHSAHALKKLLGQICCDHDCAILDTMHGTWYWDRVPSDDVQAPKIQLFNLQTYADNVEVTKNTTPRAATLKRKRDRDAEEEELDDEPIVTVVKCARTASD